MCKERKDQCISNEGKIPVSEEGVTLYPTAEWKKRGLNFTNEKNKYYIQAWKIIYEKES